MLGPKINQQECTKFQETISKDFLNLAIFNNGDTRKRKDKNWEYCISKNRMISRGLLNDTKYKVIIIGFDVAVNPRVAQNKSECLGPSNKKAYHEPVYTTDTRTELA